MNLKGTTFPEQEIRQALDDVGVLVAHDAQSDAAFCRTRFPWLRQPWACTASEVDWPAHGLVGGRSIGPLLISVGHFLPNAHRASPDAWALTCLLARQASDGRSIAAHLIDTAQRPTERLYAERAPFSRTA